jgi:ornithine cyclodeaminase/alanine dehydrogenase-like protein (mu-crystallin family)
MTVFLSEADVRELLDMRTATELMREAFVELSSEAARAPLRTAIDLPDHNARALFMPAFSPRRGRVAVKSVMVHRDNPAAGLPRIHATLLAFDAETGVPLAFIEAEHLTAVRTGAASAVATDLLARRDSEVVAIFGAGVQGETQLDAVCSVRSIRRAIVFDPTPAKAAEFCRRARSRLEIEVRPARSLDELREADVVGTATTARCPVFTAADIRPGTHINGVGSYTPETAEIPPGVIEAARLIVDQRSACLAEAGDIMQPLAAGRFEESHIQAELGEVIAGHAEGRTSDEQITVFKSVGNAVQDLAVASHLLDASRRRG